MVSARTLEVRPVPVRIKLIAAISYRRGLLVRSSYFGGEPGEGERNTCAPAWYFQALSLLKSVLRSSYMLCANRQSRTMKA